MSTGSRPPSRSRSGTRSASAGAGTRSRPNTISISFSLDSRGQTAQDFAVGIGIFLLAVAFVFSYVPSLITPYSAATTAETAQADRIADEIISSYSDETANELDATKLEGADLEELGLRAVEGENGDEIRIDRINITIIDPDEEAEDITWSHDDGDVYDGQSAGSATRLITVDEPEELDGALECENACKLTVRVW